VEGGGGDAGTPSDVVPCTGAFGAPQRIENVSSTAHDLGGYLTEDRLELYFGSLRLGGPGMLDMYVAKRASPTEPFGAPVLLAQLLSDRDEDNPFVESDGLTLWFDSYGEIMTSTRASVAAAWGAPQPAAELVSAQDDITAELSPDDRFLYFASTRLGGLGKFDLLMTSRESAGSAFAPPVFLTAANSSGEDCCPHVSPDGTELWFATDRSGNGFEIVRMARDPTTGAVSGTPTVVTEVDSASEEVDPFGTRDGAVIGFSSTRPGGLGGFDLYLMERSCP
jgi:hypothetical protein